MYIMLCSRSADLDGGNRHLLSAVLIAPFGVTFYEEYIYWSDVEASQIQRMNRFTGLEHSVLFNTTRHPQTISINHPSKQPIGQYITHSL